MRRRPPSLARRLGLAFLLASFLLAAAGLAVTVTAMDASYAGVMHASDALARDVRRAPNGALALDPIGPSAAIIRRNPGFWALAIDDRGRRLQVGAPPGDARRFLEAAPSTLTRASGIDFTAGPPSRAVKARLVRVSTPAGKVRLLVGNVSARSLTPLDWLGAARSVGIVAAVLVFIVLLIALLLLALPLVLNGLRPLANAAAAIDGGDPTRRLPEAGVVVELLPLVRAFNGALDRLEDVLERRARFMSDAAHELRTPLAILGLKIDEIAPDNAELRQSLFRLSALVGQMLDVERIRASPQRPKAVDLVEVARATTAEVAPLAYSAGYELALEAGPLPVLVLADRLAAGRALSNLLANAIAHAGGSGTIRVRVGPDATIEVCDEGPGIPEAEQSRIFEPFHRVQWDRDGCGLGLHLVREIMRLQGGDVALVAGGAGGACFRLAFGHVRPA